MTTHVSICIPVFNMADCIARAIRSALTQTYQDIEVVVVDNCSTDDTYAIACSIADPKLRVVRNERNFGCYGNHNRCIEEARGTWIKFLHGDDELMPDCVQAFVDSLKGLPSDIALLAAGAIRLGIDGEKASSSSIPSRMYVMKPTSSSQFISFGNIIGTPTMTFLRRAAVCEIGMFDLTLDPAADGDLWIALRSQYPSAVLPQHLVIVRDDPPAPIAKRAHAAVKLFNCNMRQIEKWRTKDTAFSRIPLAETAYGDFMVHECTRYLKVALLYSCYGHTALLIALLRILSSHRLLWRSLRRSIFATQRQIAWTDALSGIRL